MPLREIFKASEPSDVEAAQRRLAIAQALQQRAMQPNVPVQNGSVASQYSPATALVDLASALTASYSTGKAEKAYQRAKQAQSEKLGSAMQEMQTATPDAQVGSQALANLRASPEGELPAVATSQSQAQGDLASAMGGDAQKQIAAAILSQSMAPPKAVEPYTLSPGQQRRGAKNEIVAELPAKVDDPEKPLDELAKLNADFKAGRLSKADYDARRALMTTRATTGAGAGQGFDDPEIQDLQAAISASGYSLPAGFRSQAQQLALLKGLKRKYAGLSNDDIAHLIGSNAIDYKATTKATQTAAGIVGKVEVANNELQAFVPIARDASANVDRGSFVPWNKLQQMGEASISDPNLKRLYVATQTILNAYDLLASRGGTDQDKRAHNRAMLSSADSPEAYEAALQMIVMEGEAAGKAARASTKASAYEDKPESKPSSGPAKISSDAEYDSLASGAEFIAPDGSHRKKP